MDKSKALEALAALSQETRLDVFRLLIRAEPNGLAAGEIAAELAVRQNTMSSNLAILARAGLVTSERRGRSIHYRADLAGMRGLLAFLLQDCCDGNAQICAPLADAIACAC
jgi:DNA-binding transcriptional ArsR family regulator